MRQLTWILVMSVTLGGCSVARKDLATVKAPEVVRIVAPPPAVKDGSLWQEDTLATNSLISDVKANRRGDIVTVQVIETIDAKRERNTQTSKQQGVTANVDDVTLPLAGSVLGAAASASGRNRNLKIGGSSTRNFEGGGTVSDSGTVRATLSTQVAEVLPNGNLILIGTKEVTVGGEVQVVTISGIARQKDVTPDNTIFSTQLAEARVQISGTGPLDDAQRRTLVTKLFDWINLF